ncbi:hypothetical protein AYO47_00130 [Planctomyces sp. SCGC AG-212-M04]|nr:hypothetical protein AYO47_00130 [Planctomyces sp. SCGC AG-212-M04]
MFVRYEPKPEEPGMRHAVGPVEVWRLPEKRKIADLFEGAQVVDDVALDDSGRCLVVREGKVFLAEVNAGSVLQELPGVPTDWTSACVRNDRLVLIDGQHTCVLYDLNAKSVVTRIPMQAQLWGLGDSFFLLQALEPNPAGGLRYATIRAYDARTGVPLPHLDVLKSARSAQVSPNGGVLVLDRESEFTFCDPTTGRVLWTLSYPVLEDRSSGGGWTRFELGGKVFAQDYLGLDGVHGTARWSVADGRVIAPRPSVVRDIMDREVDPTERFAVAERTYQKPRWQVWLAAQVQWASWKLGYSPWSIDEFATTTELVDHPSDRPYGLLGRGHLWGSFSPDGSACIAASEDGLIHYYDLPPSRNWAWLVSYGFAPAVLLGLITSIVARRRRRPVLIA